VKSDLTLLLKALDFAAHNHRDQRRKDRAASPYIYHPLELANVLAREGRFGDIDLLCAPLLHDTLEDTASTPKGLRRAFGPKIARIVAEVTDDKSLSKAKRKALQVRHARHISAEAKLVKLADKICNIRDVARRPPATWDRARQREYFDWARRVIDRVRGTNPRLEAAFDAAYARRPRMNVRKSR